MFIIRKNFVTPVAKSFLLKAIALLTCATKALWFSLFFSTEDINPTNGFVSALKTASRMYGARNLPSLTAPFLFHDENALNLNQFPGQNCDFILNIHYIIEGEWILRKLSRSSPCIKEYLMRLTMILQIYSCTTGQCFILQRNKNKYLPSTTTQPQLNATIDRRTHTNLTNLCHPFGKWCTRYH